MDFLIYYETVQREYENACLLKAELERRGFSASICNTIRTNYWKSYFYKPRVTIVHGFYGINSYLITKAKRKVDAKVINLQYEQIKPRDKNGVMRCSPDGECIKAYHICWGDAAIENNIHAGVRRNHLIKTGPIQFDLMREKFKDYFLTKKEIANLYGLDEQKEWILFISDFALLSRHRTAESLPHHGEDAKYIIEYEDLAFEKIISYIEKFLQNYSDYIYIYRPHPSEPYNEDIKKLTEKYSNFKCISDRNIKQWITVADKINTWNSTSICEAYVAKKPCMVIDIEEKLMCDAMHNYKIDIIDTSKITRDYKGFEDWNRNKQLFCKEEFPLNYEKFEYYYGGYDMSVPSYMKICDFCETVLKDKKYYQCYYTKDVMRDKRIERRCYSETLKGDIRLRVFPLINRMLPSKCKLDERLAWHEPSKLKEIEDNVKRSMKL